jgi:hypothetical protein
MNDFLAILLGALLFTSLIVLIFMSMFALFALPIALLYRLIAG